MSLGFSGWKELTFFYGRDPIGFPNQATADTLRVIAPGGNWSGIPAAIKKRSLWFSHFVPRVERDVRCAYSTPVAPWVAAKSCKYDWAFGSSSGQGIDASSTASIPMPEKLVPEQVRQLRTLTDRAAALGRNTAAWRRPPAPPTRQTTTEDVAKLRESLVKESGFRKEGASVFANGDLASKQAETAKLCLGAEGDPKLQAELRQLFLDLAGLQKPDIGTLFSVSESFRKAAQLDELLTKTREQYGIDILYSPLRWGVYEHSFDNQEIRFNWILLEDDTPRKWRDLAALQYQIEWLAGNGVIQSDGTAMFHDMIYEGYSQPAIFAISCFLPLLHGTPFECVKMEAAVKRAIHTFCFYSSFQKSLPHFFAGRHRGGDSSKWPFAEHVILRLAKCGDADTGGVDKEMASIFLRYAKYYGKTAKDSPDIATFEALGIQPASMEGHMPLNYACAGIHRRDDWKLAVRGQKRGFSVNEAYPMGGENTMGRFLNYGNMIFISNDTVDFKFAPAKPSDPESRCQGWNWSLWPGTTSKLLPHDVLRSRLEVDESITSEPFCGDAGLDGDGVWGMKLQEEIPGSLDPCRIGPVKYWIGEKRFDQLMKEAHYDKDFRARKSVFMFDDRIICLGSGVKSSDADYPAVTTLFQNLLSKEGKKEGFSMGDATGAVFPIEETLDAGKSLWMIDSNGVGYYVPAGNGKIRIERKLQKLPFHIYWNFHKPELQGKIAPNEGETEFAYLDHGVACENGGYEFAMLINATPKRMEAFAGKSDRSDRSDPTDQTDLPYQALRRDNTAHIVKDAATGKTGYVIFEAGDLGLETGNSKLDKSGTVEAMTQEARTSNQASSNQFQVTSFILSASAPCVLMVKDIADGKRRLSFCNPDLGRQYAASGPSGETEQVAALTLKGTWEIVGESKEAKADTKDGSTIVTFRTFGANPAVIELKRN